MKIKHAMVGLALVASLAAASALAQAPKPERLTVIIEKLDRRTMMAKSAKGEPLKLNLAGKVLVVRLENASLADLQYSDYIGSGAMPQPDGTQKAVEVHIFA